MSFDEEPASDEMLRRITLQLADNSSRQDKTLQELMKTIAGQKTKTTMRQPKFKGTEEPFVTDFFNYFDQYAKYYSLTDDDKLLVFPSCLEENALFFFGTLQPGEIDTFKKIKDIFKEKYYPKKLEMLKIAQLHGRKMTKTESLETYSLSIQNEARKLELSDKEAKNIFVQGLQPDLKEYVMLHYPDTYAEARALAENKYAVLQTLKGSKEAELNSLIPRIQTLMEGEEGCSNNKLNELNQLRARVNQLEHSREPRKSSIKCYSCGRHGHIARDCYAKRTSFGRGRDSRAPRPPQRRPDHSNSYRHPPRATFQGNAYGTQPRNSRKESFPPRNQDPRSPSSFPVNQPEYYRYQKGNQSVRFGKPTYAKPGVNVVGPKKKETKAPKPKGTPFLKPEVNPVRPSPLVYIEGQIFNQDCKLLIDTGATVSCIDKSFLAKVCPKNYPKQKPSFNSVQTFSGESSAEVEGELTLPLQFDNVVLTQKFLILPSSFDVILGQDFLTANKAVIYLVEGKLVLN
uniref:CCHC-type domain-containing protein n=1 Tax=Clytia hemisphaerica TaxID=252671 RepID=A0A7M5WX58_9CNID